MTCCYSLCSLKVCPLRDRNDWYVINVSTTSLERKPLTFPLTLSRLAAATKLRHSEILKISSFDVAKEFNDEYLGVYPILLMNCLWSINGTEH